MVSKEKKELMMKDYTLESVGVKSKQKLVDYVRVIYPHFGNKTFEMAYNKGLFGYTYGGISGMRLKAIILMSAGFKKEAFSLYRKWKNEILSETTSKRQVMVVKKFVTLCKSMNKGANAGSGADILYVENGTLFRTKQTSRRGEFTSVFSEYRDMKVGRKLSDNSFYYYC